jgi:hypothetical protein
VQGYNAPALKSDFSSHPQFQNKAHDKSLGLCDMVEAIDKNNKHRNNRLMKYTFQTFRKIAVGVVYQKFPILTTCFTSNWRHILNGFMADQPQKRLFYTKYRSETFYTD